MLDLFGLLVLIFLVMHGLGHVLYFLASWTSVRTGFGDGSWLLPGDFDIKSALGRIWGIAALLVTGLFLLGAAGLLTGQSAWVSPTNLGILLSFVVVVPWYRESPGSTGAMAVIANLVLMFLLALPLSAELTGSA